MAALGARRAAVKVTVWAQERVPLYTGLYAGVPPIRTWRDFSGLPVLTPERLRTTPLAQQLDDPRDTLRTFTPLTLASVVTAAPIVTDNDDTDAVFYSYRDAFRLAGARPPTSIAIISSPAQRYMAAEMCDILGYFGLDAHFVIDLDRAETGRMVAALAPRRVVDLSGCAASPAGMREPGCGTSADLHQTARITVRQPGSEGADLYIVPEAGIIAVRPAGDRGYIPLRRHLLLEAERDGRLLLTTALRYHQPLIRFLLPDRGRIAGGRLWLDEVLP